MNPIRQRLDAHAQVNRFIKAQAADFGRLYDAARDEIDRRLRNEAVAAAKRGAIPHSARLLAAMEQVYPALEKAYRDKFGKAIPYVAQSAHFMALNDLKLGGKEFDADRVKLTLEDAYTHVAGMTANMKKKDVAFLRETVAGVEREAAMTGMTSRQVAAEFLTRLESRPEGFKFVDAGNRVWDSKAYCEMLARTTLLNTSRQEYLNTCAENGADVVCVTVSGHCCEKCAVWENRLLSISGATKGLPTVDDAIAEGLFHPNCTHSLSEVDDYTREEEYNPDGTPKTGEEDKNEPKPDPKPIETHEEHLTRRKEQLQRAYEHRCDEWRKTMLKDGCPKDVADEMVRMYTPEMARLGKPPKMIPTPGRGGFNFGTKELNFDPNGGHVIDTSRHEFGHWVDCCTRWRHPDSFSTELDRAANADWAILKGKAKTYQDGLQGYSITGSFWEDVSQRLFGKGILNTDPRERYVLGQYQDMIGSMTKGTYGGGHSKAYYHSRREHVELVANAVAAWQRGDDVFRLEFPEVWRYIDDIMTGR